MKKSIVAALDQGPVICAEGYLFELERRGYLQAGSFVPEVALENPEVLECVHRDFVKAGSDIIEAFTYNGHREKMRIIGKEELLEPLSINRYEAAEFAREAYAENIKYIGLCCGANPAFIRQMAEAVGKKAINSKYSPDMEKHFLYGTDPTLRKNIRGLGEKA